MRRFLSASEREADGRKKGYSGVLEADLLRSEAKLAALAGNTAPDGPTPDASSGQMASHITYVRGDDGEVLPEDPEEVPSNKEEGMERWVAEMTIRFLNGRDDEFSYEEVDENDSWDTIEDQEAEEKWFEEEEPQWVEDSDGKEGTGGDTGIQDF